MSRSSTDDQRYYILIGEKENWEISELKKIWGFSERTKGSWNKANTGDLLAFYVTRPIAKIFGFGVIKNKFIDESIVWSDEKFFGRSLWKYKITFDVIFSVNSWSDGIALPQNMILGTSRKVIQKDLFLQLIKDAEKQWKTKIPISKYVL